MTSRKKALYKVIFELLRDNFFVTKPQRMMSDYERAMRSAAKCVWPNIKTSGCVFHFRQAIRRKFKKLVPNGNDPQTERRLAILQRMIYNLQMLPSGLIRQGASEVYAQIRRYGLQNLLYAMIRYVRDFWLNKTLPENFSMYGVEHRTNNFNESLNSRMNKGMSKHPSIYEFLSFTREIMINENQRIIKKESYQQKSSMTAELEKGWERLEQGQINIRTFLRTNFSQTIR